MSGNMYEFVSKTWNPLSGKCIHNCSYCSTNGFRKRFSKMRELYSGEPRINELQMKRKFTSNDTVFVCAQNDLFANNVNVSLIDKILEHCRKFDATYLFQTKNPAGYNGFSFPEKSKLGITIESDIWYNSIMNGSPEPYLRIEAIQRFQIQLDFITIEPILDFSPMFLEMLKSLKFKQINIGADSSRSKMTEPSKDKVLNLIKELEKFTIIHQKSNLQRLLK